MTAPRHWIWIPTVGRMPYLQQAVASAHTRRLAPLEFLIGDGGESRDLQKWARRIAAASLCVRSANAPRKNQLPGARDLP